MSTGNKLRELRGTWTQNDVAEAVGVTKSSYAMYERDERTPRDEVKIHLTYQIENAGHNHSIGRFDQFMYPYFKHDIDAGIATEDDIVEMIQCIYYDVDNEFSYELIKLLLNADLRILGAPGC